MHLVSKERAQHLKGILSPIAITNCLRSQLLWPFLVCCRIRPTGTPKSLQVNKKPTSCHSLVGFIQAAGVFCPTHASCLGPSLGSWILQLNFIPSADPQSGCQFLFTLEKVLAPCLIRCNIFPAWIIFFYLFCPPLIGVHVCDSFTTLTCLSTVILLPCGCFLDLVYKL